MTPRGFFWLPLLCVLQGCQTVPVTAQDIAAAARQKDAAGTCVSFNALLYGGIHVATISVDKGVLPHGDITISADCTVTFSSRTPAVQAPAAAPRADQAPGQVSARP